MKFGSKAENLVRLNLKSAIIPKTIYFDIKDIQSNFDRCYYKIKLSFKKKLIIRSSAKDEDSSSYSKAGAYKSIKNVEITKNSIKDAINEVIRSYLIKSNKNQILIQEFIKDAESSGVITTCNLDDYGPYYNINFSKGNKTNVVTSGQDNTYNKIIFREIHHSKLNKKNKKIINLCKELEKIYNYKFLDIEFLIRKKKIYLLQVRPIIIKKNSAINQKNIENKINHGLLKLEKKIKKLQTKHYNLFGNTTYFGIMPDWNPAEIIGIKPKALSTSLYKELITDKIWAENRGDYGFKYVKSNQLMTDFLGTPFIDVRVDFNSWIPKNLNNKLTNKLINYYLSLFKKNKHLHDKIEFEILYTCFTPSTSKRLIQLKKSYFDSKEINSFSNSLKNINIIAIKNINREIEKIKVLKNKQNTIQKKNIYPIEKIYWLIEDCKNYGTSCFAGFARCGFIGIELLNSFVNEKIISREEKKEFLSSINSITSKMIIDLDKDKKKFIELYGHLRPNTYDICSKNYREGFKDFFKGKSKDNFKKVNLEFNFSSKSKLKIKRFCNNFSKGKISAEKIIWFIKNSIYYREYSKFIFSKSIDLIFDNLKLIAKRNKLNLNQIQHLNIQIIKELYYTIDSQSVSDILKKNIKQNATNFEINKYIKLPEVITNSNDIFLYTESKSKINFIGDKVIAAKIKMLNNSSKFSDIKNKIVCIENADPGYDYLFNYKISGLVTKFGGANSHMAIRCAELNIPAAIGVGNLQFEHLKEKKTLLLDPINKKVSLF